MEISETTKGKKKNQHVISIPKEVVVEILQRVPCQDLCETLKKVCMQWCSIIYSGSFAYSHVERGILKSSSSFSQLDAVVINRTHDQRSVTVSSLEWHSFPNYPCQEHEEDWKTEHMYTVNNVLDRTGIVGSMYMVRANSVNGFVCFWSSDARLHVCNPITEEYFTTPSHRTHIGRHNSIIQLAAFGVGFCQLSYEYKVVVLQDSEIEYSQVKPSVFTIGTDRSWRSLKPIPDKLFLPNIQIISGVHVKGVLYWYLKTCSRTNWLHNRHTCTQIKSLIWFDVTKEDVDMIMIPAEINSLEGEDEGRYVIVCIAEKGGNLCLVNISYGPICSLLMQVYVAHNNSTDLSSINSWKKEFTVTVPNMAYGIDVRFLFVLIVTDEILVIRIGRYDTYGFFDVATGMLVGVFSVDSWATFIPYVPSLVSLLHRPPLLNSSFRC